MKYILNNKEIEVIIIKKNNKNTYIRVKEDMKIYVTTSYKVTNKYIEKLLDDNVDYLNKMLNKRQSLNEKTESFYFLGQVYDIIFMPTKSMEIYENRIFVSDLKMLEKNINKKTLEIFKIQLDKIYSEFEEKIPYPVLKIRKMKTRWGVCNRKTNTVTLNSELIKYEINKLDYVIVHELSHFVHFNHSKNFWNLVSKYKPDYKKIRKELKE